MKKTPLEESRIKYKPLVPRILSNFDALKVLPSKEAQNSASQSHFPHLYKAPFLSFEQANAALKKEPLKIGVVLSGGQAAGGHNVIAGLFDALKKMNVNSKLFGFLGGPSGIIEGKFVEITEELLLSYRNTGGFDIIGSGRTKIETNEQLQASLQVMQNLELNGLCVIGGDDSNTNAALLAEYFLNKKCSTKVVGVPKTIDGDLKNEWIEISFGFDTACKTYSELIGNIAKDALSAKKYYHFIKLMGRSASHIALECALQTHPNLTLIGEEVLQQKKTLQQITEEIADLICQRFELGKNYGVILIPEGLIEFIHEIKILIKEINAILAVKTHNEVIEGLTNESKATFSLLPEKIQHQLLLDRDPHGNVQVSHIATEELLIHLVRKELLKRNYSGKFNPISHFFGYEGRAAFPSNFDANYCYCLGMVAALLLDSGATGYMSQILHLDQPVENWKAGGIPLAEMIHIEERKGKAKPVIKKALVELKGAPFKSFAAQRKNWELQDDYLVPGPIQFAGDATLCDATTLTLQMEAADNLKGKRHAEG